MNVLPRTKVYIATGQMDIHLVHTSMSKMMAAAYVCERVGSAFSLSVCHTYVVPNILLLILQR